MSHHVFFLIETLPCDSDCQHCHIIMITLSSPLLSSPLLSSPLQPRHAIKLLSVLNQMPQRHGPDTFFNFPGRSAAVRRTNTHTHLSFIFSKLALCILCTTAKEPAHLKGDIFFRFIIFIFRYSGLDALILNSASQCSWLFKPPPPKHPVSSDWSAHTRLTRWYRSQQQSSQSNQSIMRMCDMVMCCDVTKSRDLRQDNWRGTSGAVFSVGKMSICSCRLFNFQTFLHAQEPTTHWKTRNWHESRTGLL